MTGKLTADDKFMRLTTNINELLELITDRAVADHFGVDPDKITWADVGTAASVYERLSQICEFLDIDTVKSSSASDRV